MLRAVASLCITASMGNQRSVTFLDFTCASVAVASAACVLFSALTLAACNDNDSNTTVITTTNDPSMTTPTNPSAPTDGGATTGDTDPGTSAATEPPETTGETESTSAGTTSDSDASTDATTNGSAETTDGSQSCWPDEPPACGADGDCAERLECVDEACSCDALAMTAPDFCGVIHAVAVEAGLADPYLGFVDDMCTSGAERCTVCFNLQNYCDQLAGQCAGLYAACGCVGEFYGVN